MNIIRLFYFRFITLQNVPLAGQSYLIGRGSNSRANERERCKYNGLHYEFWRK
jgi:hypothetical protein